MDPNATLRIIRQLAARVLEREPVTAMDADAHEMALAWADLDEWLNTGGFKPAAWSQWDESLRLRRPPQ